MLLFVNPFLSSFFTISLFSSLLVDLFVIPTIKFLKNEGFFKFYLEPHLILKGKLSLNSHKACLILS